jgi:NAD(P)-dependent dehydrogenase (short-subunit alcohol dehydrogenase family)
MSRTTLTTGANSGIGLATAVHLAALGFRSLGSVRSSEKAEVLAAAAAEAGVTVEPVVIDLNDESAWAAALRDVELYGLVNNAGYLNPGAVEDVASDDALAQLETMVVTPMRLARLVLPGMRARCEGRIVNVSTVAAHLTSPMLGWYEASKHALAAVSAALRSEVASFGVEVVLIEPGGIDTNLWNKAEGDLERRRQGSAYGPAYERALRILHGAQGHMADPAEVAAVIGEALTAGHPSRHYRVGRDAGPLELANSILPASVKDMVTRSVLGLGRRLVTGKDHHS